MRYENDFSHASLITCDINHDGVNCRYSLKWEGIVLKESKFITYLSWVATVMAILMYVSYIPQIAANLAGQKANPIQPLVAAINCTLWVIYALNKKHRDIPVALSNFPGIIFGFIAFVTAL